MDLGNGTCADPEEGLGGPDSPIHPHPLENHKDDVSLGILVWTPQAVYFRSEPIVACFVYWVLVFLGILELT